MLPQTSCAESLTCLQARLITIIQSACNYQQQGCARVRAAGTAQRVASLRCLLAWLKLCPDVTSSGSLVSLTELHSQHVRAPSFSFNQVMRQLSIASFSRPCYLLHD